MFTVWHGLLSLVLMFSRLKIEALPLSTVQGKCIYTLFKVENHEIKFPPLCTKSGIDKHKFLSFTSLVDLPEIYRPAMPSMYY